MKAPVLETEIEPFPATQYPESAYSFKIIVNDIWIDTVYSHAEAKRYKQRIDAGDPEILRKVNSLLAGGL